MTLDESAAHEGGGEAAAATGAYAIVTTSF
jgi:hypothetical protein